MSRSKNSRRGSRKGRRWTRCTCWFCTPVAAKLHKVSERADEHDRRREVGYRPGGCQCVECLYGIFELDQFDFEEETALPPGDLTASGSTITNPGTK